MRLLVTGATGFIGSHVVMHARQQGIDVVAAGQRNTAAERTRHHELESVGIDVVPGDLQDTSVAERMVAGCQGVIHLAAAQLFGDELTAVVTYDRRMATAASLIDVVVASPR